MLCVCSLPRCLHTALSRASRTLQHVFLTWAVSDNLAIAESASRSSDATVQYFDASADIVVPSCHGLLFLPD